jgi:DNA-binding NarL/FixJ family response regulator
MGAVEIPFAVLVIEDDSIVRDWLRSAFKGTEFRIAGEASTSYEAREEISAGSGTQFDPSIVDAFLRSDRITLLTERRLDRVLERRAESALGNEARAEAPDLAQPHPPGRTGLRALPGREAAPEKSPRAKTQS